MNTSTKLRLMALANPKTIALLFVPLGIMLGIVMPSAESDLQNLSGGLGPLDLKLFYSPSTVWRYLDAYGPMGRELYFFLEMTADIAYPVFYTLFFWALTLWLMKKTPIEPFERAWLMPLMPLGFDLLENTTLCILLFFYPEKPVAVALLASAFTFLKWAAFTSVLGLLLYLLGQIIYQKREVVNS